MGTVIGWEVNHIPPLYSSILLNRRASNRAFFLCPALGALTPFQLTLAGLIRTIRALFFWKGMASPAPFPLPAGSVDEMKTFSAKPQDVDRRWILIDADGKTLGRLASEIAKRLRGKHKPEYTPHVDTGDYIVVINAEKLRVTGNKSADKVYYRHSGYIGGLKATNFERMIQRKPVRVLETAVRGMLPKNPLGRAMFRKLRVYAGPNHPHAAQQPEVLPL